VAHFEPPARPENGGQNRPYVVWSSAPADHGSAGGREE
jgi:hypothetical protein